MLNAKASQKNFVNYIICLVFFGAPHNGMNLRALEGSLRTSIERNRTLVEELKPSSTLVKDLKARFGRSFSRDGPKVISVLEQRETEETVVDEKGNFDKTGKKQIVVNNESGKLDWEGREHIIYDSQSDHSQVAQVTRSSSGTYQALKYHMCQSLQGPNDRRPIYPDDGFRESHPRLYRALPGIENDCSTSSASSSLQEVTEGSTNWVPSANQRF